MPDGSDAGDFGTWLDLTLAALPVNGPSDVPCGTCIACCSAAQFVHVEPTDQAALARIPAELLFPAPGLPEGHRVLGYDRLGRCPMLSDSGCTIYADRPAACRAYDCRVFAATGVSLEESSKRGIQARVDGWKFAITSESDAQRWVAVRAAAGFLKGWEETAGWPAPARALAALRIHSLFKAGSPGGRPDAAQVRAELGLSSR